MHILKQIHAQIHIYLPTYVTRAYVYIYIYSHTYTDTYTYTHRCMHACTDGSIMYACMYVRMYVRTYVCMYVLMYVLCRYTVTHAFTDIMRRYEKERGRHFLLPLVHRALQYISQCATCAKLFWVICGRTNASTATSHDVLAASRLLSRTRVACRSV